MTIEGTIIEVMESWPLQLVIKTATGTQQVLLRLETAITSNGVPATPELLAVGVRVRVDGVASGPNGMTATAVTIESSD